MFCYLDFRSYPKANDPSRFHLLLKVLLHLKFIAKSTKTLSLQASSPIFASTHEGVAKPRGEET